MVLFHHRHRAQRINVVNGLSAGAFGCMLSGGLPLHGDHLWWWFVLDSPVYLGGTSLWLSLCSALCVCLCFQILFYSQPPTSLKYPHHHHLSFFPSPSQTAYFWVKVRKRDRKTESWWWECEMEQRQMISSIIHFHTYIMWLFQDN